tara:strand:+ start:448 stop:1524 length:1077 start_codon:yes stop_codon:yes gene_type:complete
MDTLKEKRMQSTNIKEKSWQSYARNIKQLAIGVTGDNYENNDFLNEKDKVIDWIDQQSDSKQRLFMAVILIMLSPDKQDKTSQQSPIYKFYQTQLQTLANKYKQEKGEQKKSVKQEDNWVDWEQIMELQKKLQKETFLSNIKNVKLVKTEKIKGKIKYRQVAKQNLNRKQYTQLQNMLILSLYTLIKPRRLDYADMLVISKKNYKKLSGSDKEENNFLVITGKIKKFFSFGKQAQKNKNRDRNGILQSTFILDVPSKLNKVINLTQRFHPEREFKKAVITRPLLYNTRNGQLTTDGLSKAVKAIMKEAFNKNISPTMLRTIYLTDKHKGETSLEDKHTTAEEMGHTPATAENNYIKKV